jgi:ectoine hydroxylase-related dioxygenase (phytanoyl-CoA dioxygenase family)
MQSLSDQLQQLEHEGYLVIPDVLSKDEISTLRRGVERAFAVSSDESKLYGMDDIWRPKMFEYGPEFEALVDHPAVAELVDKVLGDDCHLIANSALRTGPGKGISFWHADEAVRYPRPIDVELDPRIPLPPVILNLNYYLCDVDLELGPTEFVPGSHRSGRQPLAQDKDAEGNPSYKGRGVFSAVGKAGTAVIWNDQTWHHGATNKSKDRFRWVQQVPYARRWIAQRFYPFINYRLPEGILDRATPRRKRLFGVHKLGAYG